MTSSPVDILAIAAHRDDVELTCSGALLVAAGLGRRTAILDLTQGEMGTRGSADLRRQEAEAGARVLGVPMRENAGLPDAGLVNTPETRLVVARFIRQFRPRVVIAPPVKGRHPDHRVAAELIRDACFISGLKRALPDLEPHRPLKVIHAIAYREDHEKPTFVVDISEVFERKLEAIRCYASQFDDATQAGEVYPTGDSLYDRVRQHAAYYGSLIRCRYGEPYFTHETMKVQDIAGLEVSTF